MKRLWGIGLLPLLTVSAWAQAAPQDTPPTPPDQPAAVVDSLYNEVVARHPLGLPDLKVFGPYLSKTLRHRFDAAGACFSDWIRQHPDSDLKPPSFFIEDGVFSGSSEESEPQTFHIEGTESRKDGSTRARVKLTWEDESDKLAWYVVAVVVRENDRPVVDDVLFLKHNGRGVEWRLSKILTQESKRNC
jgi:hypothetical protein